jgi:glycosyltransferase involved in cell wall biosynthesis
MEPFPIGLVANTRMIENPKFKVLIVTSELHGGSASYVAQLTGILCDHGHHVSLAFYPNRRKLELDRNVVRASRVAFGSRFSTPRGFMGNTLAILRSIRRETPDVIYTNTVFPIMAVAVLRIVRFLPKTTRIIHTLHSFFLDKFRSKVVRSAAAMIERVVSLSIDRAIAPSCYMQREAARIYEPSRVVLIRNSLSRQLELDILAVRAARKGRISQAPYRLLFVGRVDRQKGLDLLLCAFARLRQTTELHLTLGGVAPEEFAMLCKELGLELSGVECLGWVDDTSKLYAEADLFVMPSRWEAFGLTLLEARLAGVVCIGSQIDAIPELIPEECGVTVTGDSVPALVSGIEDAIERLRSFESASADHQLPTYASHESAQLALLSDVVNSHCGARGAPGS